MAKIYGKAPNRYIRHPVTGEKLTVGNTNAQADLSYQEALAMPVATINGVYSSKIFGVLADATSKRK